jgi:hypothetical protein
LCSNAVNCAGAKNGEVNLLIVTSSAVHGLSSLAGSDSLFYGRKKHHESYPDHEKVKQNNHELLFLAVNLIQ